MAEQFVVHEPHLQYNEYAYALLSELVCFILSKMSGLKFWFWGSIFKHFWEV